MNRLSHFFKRLIGRTKDLIRTPNDAKMIVIVRTDLDMSPGKIASQVAHAAVQLYDTASRKNNRYLHSWLRRGQPKIVLRSPSLEHLRDAYTTAKDHKLNACLVYDAGKTEVAGNTLTVVGIGPDEADRVNRIGCKYRLL